MRMSDLIRKKRDGGELSTAEIRWMIQSYTEGVVPDYQMSAMCMAIYFQDMTLRETYDLTMAMLDSGGRIDLRSVSGVKADKHSTGGVGDKTSLVLCPMLAACGVKMAKMSGRGLGHTGGTLDKLESFAGFSSDLDMDAFLKNVEENGFVIAGQTAELCPADKKLYALRDVTATVASMPLICSSILSKKLAAGADVIVLDVKVGSGAFMDTEEEAFKLARLMVDVGRMAGKRVMAVVSDMDEPLGRAVGNALEVREAIEALSGNGPEDLLELCMTIGSLILTESGLAAGEENARARLKDTVESGKALKCLEKFVRAQRGDGDGVYDPSRLPTAPVVHPLCAPENGVITAMDAHAIGLVSMHLGGGRATKEDEIDLAVGVELCKKVGERVSAGETLALLHARTEADAVRAAEELLKCYTLGPEMMPRKPFIRGIVK